MVAGRRRHPGTHRFSHAVDAQHIALRDPVVISWVFELEREDAEIRQILPVNPGKLSGDEDTPVAFSKHSFIDRYVFPDGEITGSD